MPLAFEFEMQIFAQLLKNPWGGSPNQRNSLSIVILLSQLRQGTGSHTNRSCISLHVCNLYTTIGLCLIL